MDLDLLLDPAAGSVEGTVTYTLARLRSEVFELDQVGLQIDEVRLGGAPVQWWVEGDRLLIGLSDAAEDAERVLASLAIDYRATPRTGLHFRGPGTASAFADSAGDAYPEVWSQGEQIDHRHWIPLWDHPNDRFTYTGRFALPDGYDDWKVLTNSGLDMVSYLIMVTAAPYQVVGEEDNQVWVPQGTDDEVAQRARRAVPEMMRWFGWRTGVQYPWGPYRQVFVQRFIYGGMENTTATIEALRLLSGPSIAQTRGRRHQSVFAHELAHQWYGDLLTCRMAGASSG